MLLSTCHNRNMPSEEEIAISMTDDILPPYMPFGPRGARITGTSAISLINRYSASLPCDMTTKLTPSWSIRVIGPDSVKLEYECTLRMPINSPLRVPIVGEIMKQKKTAKMAAALKACQMLDSLGELNEHLVPISCLVDKALEEELGLIEEELTDGAQPGTNRRRQVYEKKVPIFLKDSRPNAEYPCYLHVFHMKLVTPLPSVLNPRKRPIIDPSDTTRGLGILSSKILPSVNPFPVFTKSGKILITTSFLKVMNMQKEKLTTLKGFHRFIVSDALWLENEKLFLPDGAEFSCFIVPVNKDSKSSLDIDWNFIEATKSHPYNSMKLKTFKTMDRTTFDPNLFTDAVALRAYKVDEWKMERPSFHHITEILYDKSPNSKFESKHYETYKHYYKVKYDYEFKTDDQPLVQTVQNSNMHLWKPIYVSTKQTYDDVALSNTKQRRMNYQEYLVPELCLLHPFPSSFMYKVLCLPTILFRLHSLLLAEEIRQTVATQGYIGFVQPNLNISWPEFHLESSDKELKTYLKEQFSISYSGSSNINPVDVVKHDGKIISFEAKVSLKNHPGPNPCLILKALTAKSAGDEFDLERLEMIGDSFLKYVMSIKTYVKYPTFDEGKLTKLRNGLIQNLRLYQCAKKKKLAQYLICSGFNCNSTWLPPCYVLDETVDPKAVNKLKRSSDEESDIKYLYFTKHIISDKCLADSVEALIGAYLLSCGQKGALMFMSWMGLKPLPLSEDSSDCREASKNWPPEPSSPIICDVVPHVEDCLRRLTTGFNAFESIINYRFKNKAYLLQAFTHPSYSYNEITDCYQRLEFLGDAVLDYLITRQLYEDPNDHSPEKLTDLRSALVNNIFFASLAVKYQYHKFLKMLSPHLLKLLDHFVELLQNSKAFNQFEIHGYYLEEVECYVLEEVEVPKALGDIFESVAGAIYLDSGMSLDVVWNVYSPMITPAMKHFSVHVPISPVRELYELLGTKDVFGEVIQKGDKTYIQVKVNGIAFVGVGPNKKVAKRSAAKRVIAYKRSQQMDTS